MLSSSVFVVYGSLTLSSFQIPNADLVDIGPTALFQLGRVKWCPENTMKQATYVPKTKDTVVKNKNVSRGVLCWWWLCVGG